MMKRIGYIIGTAVILTAIGVTHVWGQQPARQKMIEKTASKRASATHGKTFAAVDVFIDSGKEPLAAYQFELTAKRGAFKIVGVEGGEHAAFAQPPYYDPAALMRDRIIIAAFNTGGDLPNGRTRVARIHIEYEGNQTPEIGVELSVTADSGGQSIPATADVAQASQG